VIAWDILNPLHSGPISLANTTSTMSTSSSLHPSAPAPGVYVPAITFFDPTTDELCPSAQTKYYRYLSTTGVRGLVILGTNAETFLLSRSERHTLLTLARSSVPASFPLIAGVSGHSTSQVLEYIADAYDAGVNYALLLPCAYFGKQTTPGVVESFFADVARVSPLPIIVYNFPAVCNGLDLDSEIITRIAKANTNIVGVKLTCGSVAKITRLAATFPVERFAVFGGQADFLVGGLAAGSAGCIGAFGNVAPRTIAQVYDLWATGQHDRAYKLQQVAALAESPTKAGIANTKYAAAIGTAKKAGVENAVALARPRRPYMEPSKSEKESIRKAVASLAESEDGETEGVLELRAHL
jgi:4-hydroxy-2-oxoglutarate aldolase